MRFEFIATIAWDTLVILTAIAARWIVLRLLTATTAPDSQSWAIRALEFISDFGMVAAATIYTVFDLSKRVVLGGRSFFSLFRHDDERGN